uniref:Copper homeostasis protein CutC n=1 Tax=Haemonchus placei TaxID=6290 RepID=A0A0N4X7G7_HAEPC
LHEKGINLVTGSGLNIQNDIAGGRQLLETLRRRCVTWKSQFLFVA